jgi:hypothetical protein
MQPVIKELEGKLKNTKTILAILHKHPNLLSPEDDPSITPLQNLIEINYWRCPADRVLTAIKEVFGVEGWTKQADHYNISWGLRRHISQDFEVDITLHHMEQAVPLPVKPTEWPILLEGGEG